ncbi:hypothetical protein D9757_006018 [Collybiopsis confluens]|uniref:C2H2-type domain-containing protein n=1 Tax=Collybiopsis confluens TaxID=2823264 RepID=A0A8H5MD73_9AGAR|nr:hypothetical protein D9757_006018 [Collybiopsis confluens]
MNPNGISASSISLPSIDEMFPIHLIVLPPRRRLELFEEKSPLLKQSTSLAKTHFNGGVFPDETEFRRLVADYQQSDDSSESSPTMSGGSDENQPEQVQRQDRTRRHVCVKCSKSFNRPSSLRIHTHIHNGVTPFQCPYPGCGRRFNVSSNMRRHYRKHTYPPPAFAFTEHGSAVKIQHISGLENSIKNNRRRR